MVTFAARWFVVNAIAALAVTACGAVVFAGVAAAAPAVHDNYVEETDCHTTTQVCRDVAKVVYPFNTHSVKVTFTANQNHCSDIIDHILVDGLEWGFRVVGPGQSDGGQVIPLDNPIPGYHEIGVRAEGITGGCNTGYLHAWGGRLHIEEIPDGSGQ